MACRCAFPNIYNVNALPQHRRLLQNSLGQLLPRCLICICRSCDVVQVVVKVVFPCCTAWWQSHLSILYKTAVGHAVTPAVVDVSRLREWFGRIARFLFDAYVGALWSVSGATYARRFHVTLWPRHGVSARAMCSRAKRRPPPGFWSSQVKLPDRENGTYVRAHGRRSGGGAGNCLGRSAPPGVLNAIFLMLFSLKWSASHP